MVDVVVLKTFASDVDSDVQKNVDKFLGHVKEGDVAGVAMAITFRNGKSVTFASKSEDRQKMLGSIVDLLFDYQSGAK